MAITNQKFREIVFLTLYCSDLANLELSATIPLLMEQLIVSRKNVLSAGERARRILELLPEIDQLITQASFSYAFERIQIIEKNVLRLGIFELFFDESIPPKVAISEALRLTKKFGTPESTSFVNAILDNLYKKSLGQEPDKAAFLQTLAVLEQSETLIKKAQKHGSDSAAEK